MINLLSQFAQSSSEDAAAGVAVAGLGFILFILLAFGGRCCNHRYSVLDHVTCSRPTTSGY